MDSVLNCPILRCFLWLLKFKIWMFSHSALLIAVGVVAVISWNSDSPEEGTSLKWQISHIHSWDLREFFMIRIAFGVEHCKCTKLLQWIRINLLEFIGTVLLRSWQVDNRKPSDFGLVYWLSQFTCPRIVSMSLDSTSLCFAEMLLLQKIGFDDFLMVLFCIHSFGFSVMMVLDCCFSSAFALENSKYRSRIIQQVFVIRFSMLVHK